jgi:phosphatidylglycerol:prolipoprotein diacylglycerol transferase
VVGEIFREPDAPLLFGVSRGIFYSLFMVIAGVLIILRQRRRASVSGA